MRELVHELQTELAGSGDHDGRLRNFRDAYNDSPLGPALPAGVREALAALRSTRWRIVEDGRDYVKVHGQWLYLYRAVDKAGQTVDFFLSRNRDVNAAKSFLRSAMKSTRLPTKITLDAYAASHRAVREMKADGELPGCVKVRSSQYLDNLVEIAFTQPNVLAARMSGNHVTDFDFAVGHKDTVD